MRIIAEFLVYCLAVVLLYLMLLGAFSLSYGHEGWICPTTQAQCDQCCDDGDCAYAEIEILPSDGWLTKVAWRIGGQSGTLMVAPYKIHRVTAPFGRESICTIGHELPIQYPEPAPGEWEDESSLDLNNVFCVFYATAYF